MKRGFILLLVLAVFISSTFATSIECDSLLVLGTQQIKVENYQNALETYQNLIQSYPNYPVGYFCLAGVYQTIMRNYRVSTYETEFDSLINIAIDIGEQTIKHTDDDVFARLYLGKSYGYRGLHQSRKGNWISAINDGRKGIGLIQMALEADTSLYDAYCWIGSYHYWRAVKTKISGFIFRNDKEKGIDEIRWAIQKCPFIAVDGKYNLVAIYYHKGDYEQALKMNQEIFVQYPTNPSCLYMRSRIYEELENWPKARESIFCLLNHLNKSEYQSTGYQIECLYRLSLYEYRMDNSVKSYDYLKQAYQLLKKRDESRELEGPLETFEDIVEEMGKLHLALEEVRRVGSVEKQSHSS